MRRSVPAAALVLAATALASSACGGSSSPGVVVRAAKVVEPPHGSVVDAREWGTRDVALARRGTVDVVQVVDAEGRGVDGLPLRIGGTATAACGDGCYRGDAARGPVTVAVGSVHWRFTIPTTAPSGAALLTAVMRTYAEQPVSRLDERLASGPTNPLVSHFTFVAPNRLRYTIVGGSQAIVIGATRWDRASGSARWVRSSQDPTDVMRLPWQGAYDVRIVAPHTITFFLPGTRAWFRVEVEPGASLPRTVSMTGISHFMTDRYSGFGRPASVVPPG